MTSKLLKVDHDLGQVLGFDLYAIVLLAYLVALAKDAAQVAPRPGRWYRSPEPPMPTRGGSSLK
jgi:hypothetical protein